MALITISRNVGSGGEKIAKRVANDLNLELYDDTRLQETAVKMGVPVEELNRLDEKAPGLFDRMLSKKPEVYLDMMEAVVYDIAHQGKGVILGHGSQILLRDFDCALHVYVHSTGPSRLKYIMEQRGIGKDAAEKFIRKSDSRQKGFFQFAFRLDWNDPSLYDLIINTEKMGIDSAVALITEAAQSENVLACSLKAVDAMERMSQEKKVEAALLKNDINLILLNIEVPEIGVAHISGSVYSPSEIEKISQIVNGVDGISEVKNDTVPMPASI